MKNINWNKIWPHLVAIGIFVILTAAFFSPIFEGKMVKMEDMNRYRGMSQEANIVKDIDGEYPLWTNSMFGGMPTYQITSLNQANNLEYIDKILHLGFPYYVGFFLICFFSFYFLCFVLRTKPIIGIIGSIAYSFSTYFIIIIQAGHVSKLHAIAYIPAVIAAMILTYQKNWKLGGSLFALFMGLEILSNHFQITYYLFFILLAIFLYFLHIQVFKNKNFKSFLLKTGVLALATALALLANTSTVWTTYSYSKQTTRGPSELTVTPQNQENQTSEESGLDFDYITRWSYGKGESFSLLFPNAKGGASGSAISTQEEFQELENPELQKYISMVGYVNSYWGTQPFTSGPVYVGALVFALFILGMVFIKSPLKWWILGISILALLLSWGKNLPWLTHFFINNFPMYNKFRAVTMILVVVEFCIPFLAVLYLKELYENRKEHANKIKYFLIPSGIIIFILLVFLVAPTAFFEFFNEDEKKQFGQLAQKLQGQLNIDAVKSGILDLRVSSFRSDVGRALLFIILGLGSVFLYLKGKLKFIPLGVILVVLVTADLIPVNLRYLGREKNEKNDQYKHWVDYDLFYYPISLNQADQAIYNNENNEKTKELENKLYALKIKERNDEPLIKNQIDAIKMGALNMTTNYRVFKLGDPFNDAYTSYFHKNVGGYHGAKLKRYQQLNEFYISNEHQLIFSNLSKIRSIQDFNQLTSSLDILNMFNTKYIIVDNSILNELNKRKLLTQELLDFVNSYNQAIPNNSRNGEAWFIEEVVWAKTPDDEILKTGEINTKKQVVIPTKYKDEVNKANYSPINNDEGIEMTSYHPEHLTYQVKTNEDRYAVFSEIYYSNGWNAYIDGKLVPHQQVNFVLRGLNVPKGEHKVEFKFEPEINFLHQLNFAFSLITILLAFTTIGLEIKKKIKR